jgi:hypothetical protein
LNPIPASEGNRSETDCPAGSQEAPRPTRVGVPFSTRVAATPCALRQRLGVSHLPPQRHLVPPPSGWAGPDLNDPLTRLTCGRGCFSVTDEYSRVNSFLPTMICGGVAGPAVTSYASRSKAAQHDWPLVDCGLGTRPREEEPLPCSTSRQPSPREPVVSPCQRAGHACWPWLR